MIEKPMSDKEAIDMLLRCRDEISRLRATIDSLAPKADAYDNIVKILRLLPGPSVSMSEDLVWRIDQRIKELTPKSEKSDD